MTERYQTLNSQGWLGPRLTHRASEYPETRPFPCKGLLSWTPPAQPRFSSRIGLVGWAIYPVASSTQAACPGPERTSPEANPGFSRWSCRPWLFVSSLPSPQEAVLCVPGSHQGTTPASALLPLHDISHSASPGSGPGPPHLLLPCTPSPKSSLRPQPPGSSHQTSSVHRKLSGCALTSPLRSPRAFAWPIAGSHPPTPSFRLTRPALPCCPVCTAAPLASLGWPCRSLVLLMSLLGQGQPSAP